MFTFTKKNKNVLTKKSLKVDYLVLNKLLKNVSVSFDVQDFANDMVNDMVNDIYDLIAVEVVNKIFDEIIDS